MAARAAALRSLPSVDALLRAVARSRAFTGYPRALLAGTLRAVLAEARAAVARSDAVPDTEALLARAAERLAALAAPSLRRVVNASGVVLHTNLGRAALAESAVAALRATAAAPSNLELDLATGRRGRRDAHVEAPLCALTGAEAATVVNNNAAAVLLALDTLADGREVIVSRGELVEIGGAFRIPDIVAKSGAVLREVGTTNRTHRRDIERALGERTALLLKVHPSNYRITGFTAAVALADLVAIGAAHGVPVMEDLGSGALVDLTAYGLPAEPVVADRVRAGADVVTFSGDKLLGGPQCGVLVGRRAIIDAMRENPLYRALRCDKLTLAALEATLRLYRTAPDLAAVLPSLRDLTRPIAELERVGTAACALLRAALGPAYAVAVVDTVAEIGSGAQPTQPLQSKAIAITHTAIAPQALAARFRAAAPPIIGRVADDRFLLDLRCIADPADLVPHERPAPGTGP
jgi:L-seryl-tRNA(Ser) seleniumtransferase